MPSGVNWPTQDAGEYSGGLKLGVKTTFGFRPRFQVGRDAGNAGPYHSFESPDLVEPEFGVWLPFDDPIIGDRARIRLNVQAGVSEGDDRKPDKAENGFISLINGLNTAAITGSRNTRLDHDLLRLGGSVLKETDFFLSNSVLALLTLGAIVQYYDYEYRFSEEVTGNGVNFFTNALNIGMDGYFVGPLVGLMLATKLGQIPKAWGQSDVYFLIGGAVALGYLSYNLKALQSGTALGATVQLNDSVDAFAYRTNVQTGVAFDVTKSTRLSLLTGVDFDNAEPDFEYPAGGATFLRAVRASGDSSFWLRTAVTVRLNY